jgi:hypothetical protein
MKRVLRALKGYEQRLAVAPRLANPLARTQWRSSMAVELGAAVRSEADSKEVSDGGLCDKGSHDRGREANSGPEVAFTTGPEVAFTIGPEVAFTTGPEVAFTTVRQGKSLEISPALGAPIVKATSGPVVGVGSVWGHAGEATSRRVGGIALRRVDGSAHAVAGAAPAPATRGWATAAGASLAPAARGRA